MNKLTKLALIGLAFVSMIGLSACNAGTQETINSQKTTGDGLVIANTGTNGVRGYNADKVKVPDGRIFTCIRFYDGGSSSSVISCTPDK